MMKRWIKMIGINMFLGSAMGWIANVLFTISVEKPVDRTLLGILLMFYVIMMITTALISSLVPVIGLKEDDELPKPNDTFVSLAMWMVLSLAFILPQIFWFFG